MLKCRLCFVLLLFLTFSWGETVLASENPDQVFQLGEIIVSDTTGVKDIAITNTVTEVEIEKMGATTVSEALRFVPGVSVLSNSKGEGQISIQGFSQKDILILIDGIPYYETKYGSLDLNQIPASIISKIDVTKGASSVLYGPNGMGGVVNIITKKGMEGFSGKIKGEIGQDGYHHEVVTLSAGSQNGFSILGTIDNKSRDSFRMSNDYTPDTSTFRGKGGANTDRVVEDGGDRNNSDLDSLNLWTRIGYASDRFETYASIYRFELERGRPINTLTNKASKDYGDYSAFTSFNRVDPYLDTGIDLNSKVKAKDWLSFRGLFFYRKHEDTYLSYYDESFDDLIGISEYENRSIGGALFSDMDFGPKSQLSLSVNYKEDGHDNLDPPGTPAEKSRSNTLSLAAENTSKFGAFTWVTGIAYHNYEVDEARSKTDTQTDSNTFDPMTGLSWVSESGLRIYGSIAKKTRFATFDDMSYKDVNGDYQIVTLDPQRNLNYTLGIEKRFWDRMTLNLSGFYNDVSDMISERTNSLGEDIPVNIDEVEIYGVEFSSKTDILTDLSLGLDYTYVYARNKSDQRESDFIEEMPEQTVGASINYLIPYVEVDASLRGLWRMDTCLNSDPDEMVFEDSFTMDLTLSRKIGKNIRIYLNAYNLFDEFHYEDYGMPNEGRFVKAGVEFSF